MFSSTSGIFAVVSKERTLTLIYLLVRFLMLASYISRTILERLATGALSVWGRVGEIWPPHLVMPLTVEPSKPCLCSDDRFINLWTVQSKAN